MNIRTTHIGVIAQRVIASLSQSGCQVLAVKAAPSRPMIEIAYPSDELKRDAIEIAEQVNGLRRRAWTARLGGCVIHWHEAPVRDDFEFTANMNASEYLAYRAAGYPA